MCYLHAAGNGGTTDPCATAPSGGLYCGQSPQWGGGQKDVLYDCQNGVTVNKTPCPNGCRVAPYGQNDACNPPPPPPPPQDAGGGGSDAGHSSDGGAKADGGATDGGVTPPSPDGGVVASADAGAADDGGGDNAATPADSTASSGGCSVASGGDARTGAFAWAIGLGVAMMGLRRRRRD